LLKLNAGLFLPIFFAWKIKFDKIGPGINFWKPFPYL